MKVSISFIALFYVWICVVGAQVQPDPTFKTATGNGYNTTSNFDDENASNPNLVELHEARTEYTKHLIDKQRAGGGT